MKILNLKNRWKIYKKIEFHKNHGKVKVKNRIIILNSAGKTMKKWKAYT